jgi:5'-nucleotidase
MDECRPACVPLLLDGGDQFTGPLSSNLQHGRPVVALMNAMGVSASALGNHEYDWGVDTLRRRVGEQRHATLGANVRGPDGRRPSWLRADTLIERDGLRIGVVGVAGTHTATSTHWRHVRGYRFDDPAPVIDAHTRALRARGATHVVAIIHDGAFCDRDRPAQCTGPAIDITAALRERVDAVVAAHSHTLVDARVGGIPVVQARSSGRAIGVIDLPLDGGAPRTAVRPVLADEVDGVPPVVDSLVAAAIARAAAVGDRVVATLAVDLAKEGRQHALGQLIADAQRAVGRGDMAIMNDGGIRSPLRAGPLTYGQLYAVQPFGNQLMRLRLRGRDLPALFEIAIGDRGPSDHVSGVRVTWDSTAARGARVVGLALADGRPIRPAQSYTVVLNDFIYGSELPAAVRRAALAAEPLPIADLAALERHLRTLPSPVHPVVEPRFIERRAAAVTGGVGARP